MKVKFWRVKHAVASALMASMAVVSAWNIHLQSDSGFLVVLCTVAYSAFTLLSLVFLRNHLMDAERLRSGRGSGPFLDSLAKMWGTKRAYAGWETDCSLAGRLVKIVKHHDAEMWL